MSIDVATLARELTTFLVPFLPYLTVAGGKAIEEVGKKVGGEAWDRAKTLWGKVQPTVHAKPAAQEAVQDVVTKPDDEDSVAAFRLQLKKLLSEDAALAEELETLWIEAKQAGVAVTVTGERNVGIGGNVSDSTIITGDGNQR